MWFQRSRINWFRDGDRNTSFFHAKALARLKKNQIDGLYDAHEMWQEEEGKVGDIVEEYFTGLFASNQPAEFNELLQALQTKVAPQMNQMLDKVFAASEVHVVLKQMHPLKAPRSDGMSPLFYQKFWPIIGDIVTNNILDFPNHSVYPPNFNETHIVC